MATYQDESRVHLRPHAAFDVTHKPGKLAPDAGIYRCINCGHEIGIAQGHELPPQNHGQHPAGKPIIWQLLVFAQHVRPK